MVDIDLIVVNYKTYIYLQSFIDSYHLHKPTTTSRLIIIDNESKDSSLGGCEIGNGDMAVALPDNAGYAGGCNFGASLGDSKYIGLFNSDTRFVDPHSIDSCISFMEENPDVGIVGPLQYNSCREVTHAGREGDFDSLRDIGWRSSRISDYRNEVRDSVSLSGSALIIRRTVWGELADCEIFRNEFSGTSGAMPPFPHFYEDTLLCYHAQKHGYRTVFYGKAEMIHEWHMSSPVGSQSANAEIGRKAFNSFRVKHDSDHNGLS